MQDSVYGDVEVTQILQSNVLYGSRLPEICLELKCKIHASQQKDLHLHACAIR
jgi:hypothetical protein